MKKLLLLITATAILLAGTISSPTDGTVKVKDTKITGVQCFQNLSGFNVRWSTAPITGDNLGAILRPRETTCVSAQTDIYFRAEITVPIQCWAARP